MRVIALNDLIYFSNLIISKVYYNNVLLFIFTNRMLWGFEENLAKI